MKDLKFNHELFRKDLIMQRVIELEITVREVAEIAGVSASTISRIENRKSFDMETFVKLCQWLKSEPSKYFQVTGERQDGFKPDMR